MIRSALITGGSGQDAWYLARLLVQQGYAVHLQSRRALEEDFGVPVQLHVGDIKEHAFLADLVGSIRPDEIYNLAAVSSPTLSWSIPLETAAVNAFVPQHLCELILKTNSACRLFQATSSEIFGDTQEFSQSETSQRHPKSPYAISKDYAHRIVGVYREQYGLHLSSGILFNHESPRRPLTYVSQKIAFGAAALALGRANSSRSDTHGQAIIEGGRLRLGNMDVRRDFGFAGDYVSAMHLILQQDKGDDFVIGTGEHHSIAEFCDAAFTHVGLDWRDHVVSDPALFRKNDNHYTHADISKLSATLRWRPTTGFRELVGLMVDAQTHLLKKS